MAAETQVRRSASTVLAITASSAVTAWLVGRTISQVAPHKTAPWLLARAAGVCSYLLMVALACMGLLLSHPAAARLRRPGPAVRLRIHVSLAVFTLAFTVLHIVALASDKYAGVGWRGTVIPGVATYRPLPVTLGVLGMYAGLLAGLTAALAGRLAARVWWPIHKVAIATLALVWVHGFLAGSDTPALRALYVATGGLVVTLAVSRYTARTSTEHVEQLLRNSDTKQVMP